MQPTANTLPSEVTRHPMPLRSIIAATLMALGLWLASGALLDATAHARQLGSRDPVTFRFSGDRTYVGQPITVEVQVRSDGSFEGPTPPVVPGAEVSSSTPSRSEFTEIINGRVSRSVTLTHRFTITPSAEGTITVPPIAVTVGGQRYSSEPHRITVLPLASDDRLFADIVVDPTTAWVGQGLEVTLRIWIKRHTDPRWSVTIPAESMWSFLEDSSRWGVFESTVRAFAQARNRPPHKVMRREGPDGESSTYDVFEIARRLYPGRAGPLDLGSVSIRMNYPSRLERGTDIFDRGSLRVTQSVPLVAVPAAPPVTIRPLPTEGRPPTFAGAVGRFEIEATATPTDVAVGDPIDLTLVIKDRTVGGADLATLSPPKLAEQADLIADYRVSTDPVPGSVQGWMKTFTIVIRPLREGLTTIPPVMMAYFDPVDGVYREAVSQAIPIKVRRGVAMDLTRIVDARGDIGQAAGRPLGAAQTGILANETDARRLLRQQTLALTPTTVGLAVLPPLAVLGIAAGLVVRHHAERTEPTRRRRRAPQRAQKLLGRAKSAADVRAALIACIADLSGRSAGALTAEDAVAGANELGADSTTVRSLRELLGACDLAAFGPGVTQAGAGLGDIDSLRARALECVRQLPDGAPSGAASITSGIASGFTSGIASGVTSGGEVRR